jgi:multidrug efflux pump subunit AcrB
MRGLVAAFARNTVFANIILVLIFMAGGLAAAFMIRETFPEVTLDLVLVSVPYPGADPEEVEEGICRKIEEALEGIEGIKQINTSSSENLGAADIEILESYDVDEVLDRIRSAIDGISTFPVDAEKPITRKFVLRDMVCVLALSGEMSERRLKEWAESVKDELQLTPQISQVEVFGTRDYEIAVEVSEEKLREYGLSLNDVSRAVRQSNLNLAGGTIRTRGEDIRVRTIGRKYTGEEFASIIVLARSGGERITLDRIATIRDAFTEDAIEPSVNGEPAVFLLVFKTEEEDGITISNTVQDYVARKQPQLPPGAGITLLLDTSTFLRARINLLLRNGAIGLTLVFLLLWLFLDLRLSSGWAWGCRFRLPGRWRFCGRPAERST